MAKVVVKTKPKRMTEANVVYRNLEDLKPYENNPRKITEKAIDAVMNSIKKMGIKVYPVIDKNNVIICGHTRWKALQKLRLEDEMAIDFTKIPCILADDLTPQEVKALRLIDNKTSEHSLWDDEKLEMEMGEIEDIDLSEFGFDVISDETDLGNQKEIDLDKTKEGKKCQCPNCGFEFEV